jgi:hypothetical protein
MNLATALRRDLCQRANKYVDMESIPHCLSYGDASTICFFPYERDLRHGNFFPGSYKAILTKPEWKRRLAKVHTLARRSFPVTDRGRWRELDTCTSSDALLMNIFCHPRVLREGRVLAFLGADPTATPLFGYKARVPLANCRFDRTEVDMRIGDLLIEAKLTESNFQRAEKKTLHAYRDFSRVFDCRQLPQTRDSYFSYQLVRNVLAAYALQCSFCVLIDVRRADLADAWCEVVQCVKPVELRTRLKISTWQELTPNTPTPLRRFLIAKYGFGETIPRSSTGRLRLAIDRKPACHI